MLRSHKSIAYVRAQDGRIIKWPMNASWSGMVPGKRARFISDLTSYYVFSLSFFPNTGRKYAS